MMRESVFDIIWNERDAQVEVLATRKSPLGISDWLNFIDEHLLRARRAESLTETMDEIRNLAACAVAAMEGYGARPRNNQGPRTQIDILGVGRDSGPEDIGAGALRTPSHGDPLRASVLAGLMQTSFDKSKKPSSNRYYGKKTVDSDEDGG